MELLTMSKMPYQQQVQEWQYTTQNDQQKDTKNWIKGPYNTYGKMVTQNFLTPDGTKHAQKKQMEIVQARTSSGALQVVRAQTVQSMSSRSISDSTPIKAGTTTTNKSSPLFSTSAKLFGNAVPNTTSTGDTRNLFSSPISLSNIDNNNRIVVKMRNDQTNGHDGTLSRGKSISNDDLPKVNGSDDEGEFGQWSRVSRIRRSLQFPSPNSHRSTRPTDFPQESVDVSKIRQELENISRRNSFVKSSSNESSSSFESKEASKPIRPIPDTTDVTPVSANILKQVRSQLKRLDSNESTPESPSFLRRKSYGFEKIESTDAKMESSTDSGLSLSNDLHSSSWTNSPRSNRVKLSPTRITLFSDSHLISHPHEDAASKRYTTALENILVENEKKQTKKVEFCKTEIHFAPDSGRVNIVETDGKPLPSTNFRRRRRSSNSSVSSSSSMMYSEEEDGAVTAVKQEEAKVNVVTEVQSIVPEPVIEIFDANEELRGILKNKPIKPKQYHLGENINDIDNFWGVKLKSTQSSPEKSTVSSAYSRLKEEREELFDHAKRFSTKINLTRDNPLTDDHFVTKLDINETKPAHLIDSTGLWSAVEIKMKKSSDETNRLISVIAPEDELKSYSLIKNCTIKKTQSLTSSANNNILAETTRIKHDLDEAFKDLLSVSASLREIENRNNLSPPTRAATTTTTRRLTVDLPTLKPVPLPRKRPTTLEIKSPITPASPESTVKPVFINQRISIKQEEEQTEKVVDERKSVVVLQSHEKVNTPIQIQLYSPTNSLQRPTTSKSTTTKQFKHPTPLPRSTLSDSESVVKPKVSKFVSAFSQQQPIKSGTRKLKEHELAYFGVGGAGGGGGGKRSVKVEGSSSYRNGYSSAQKYESSGDELETRSSLKRIMENRQIESVSEVYDRKLDRKRDEEILDELTKASEEIMNTVKLMEEKEKEKKRRPSKNLYHMEIMETITERPGSRPSLAGAPRHTKERSIVREERKSSLSSASSSECLSPFTRASRFVSKSSSSSVKEPMKPKAAHSRGCRVHRTPSRELAQSQTRGSSSEDLATPIVEPPRRVRRTKTAADEPVSSISRRPRQPTPRESPATSTTSKERIYTHRLRKVDNISKPSTTSTSRRISRTKASTSSKTK